MATVGIGLPVRNGERHLAATLESLRAQTFSDFEVVVLDNASTDATGQIAQKVAAADPRFVYRRREQHVGVEDNFNAALAASSAPLHMWAANDLYHPRYLETCVALLAARPDAVAATTVVRPVDEDGRFLPGQPEADLKIDHPDPLVRFAELASYRHACLTLYAVMRRDVVLRIRPLAPYRGSDRLFLAELALHGPLLRHPEPLFYSRWHPDLDESELRHPPLRAPTVHHARQLAGALRRSRVPWWRGQRTFARWCWENRNLLVRSAARGVLSTLAVREAPVREAA